MSGPADKVAQPYTPTATPRKPDAKPDTPRKAPVELGKGPFAGSPTAAPLAASSPSAPPIARPPGPSRLLDRFAFDSDAPTASHLKQIDAFAGEIAREAQKGGGPIKIVVTGHTDTSGKETYNEGLGLRRAEKTKAVIEAALRKAGVGPTAIDSIEVLSAGRRLRSSKRPMRSVKLAIAPPKSRHRCLSRRLRYRPRRPNRRRSRSTCSRSLRRRYRRSPSALRIHIFPTFLDRRASGCRITSATTPSFTSCRKVCAIS